MLIWDEVIYSDGLLGMLYSRLIESVSMQGWKIDAADDSPEAQQQKNALEEFYNSVTGLQQSPSRSRRPPPPIYWGRLGPEV